MKKGEKIICVCGKKTFVANFDLMGDGDYSIILEENGTSIGNKIYYQCCIEKLETELHNSKLKILELRVEIAYEKGTGIEEAEKELEDYKKLRGKKDE